MLKKVICLVFAIAVSAILFFGCTEQPPPPPAPAPAPTTPAPQTEAEKAWGAASIYVGREESTPEDIVYSLVRTIAHFRNQGHMTDVFSETALKEYKNGASLLGAVTYVFPDMRDGGWDFYTGPFMNEGIILTDGTVLFAPTDSEPDW